MMERSRNQNKKALGAGALVRCPVLAAFGCKVPSASEAAELARTDTRLSHPDLTLCEASAAYVVLVRSLIMRHGDRKAALDELREWMDKESAAREPGKSLAAAGNPKGWVHLAKQEKPKDGSGKKE